MTAHAVFMQSGSACMWMQDKREMPILYLNTLQLKRDQATSVFFEYSSNMDGLISGRM